jgi:diadenosine tetraphosphatase ApaH/serine/threonine PP2A family protein phosphatase
MSDVHGNLPAFEAVLSELEQRGPFDGIYYGGDAVINGLYPAECVQKLIDLGWESVQGNADEWAAACAAGDVDTPELTPAEEQERESLLVRGNWTASRLDEEHVAFLASMPLNRTFTGPSGQTLMLAHATPWSVHVAIRHNDPEQPKREALERAGTDALIYGHIHHAYQQEIDCKTICCAGAVGSPFDGDTRACFAIMTDQGDGWSFEHARVDYDHEAYARELEASDMPAATATAQSVRTASR